MWLKKKDKVLVLAGRDKGKRGEILKREEKGETKGEKKEARVEKEEPIVTAAPHKRETIPPAPEDDETWGAIPAFLRRHKK